PPPAQRPDSPATIPGLQLWLPAFDPTKFYSDFGSYSNPLPLDPQVGASTRSIFDASPNQYLLQNDSQYRQILYDEDSVIGPSWSFDASSNAQIRSELWVHDSHGTSAHNFDFVQNTGVFTFSAFVKIGNETGNYMTLFDTNEALTSQPGFTLLRMQNG